MKVAYDLQVMHPKVTADIIRNMQQHLSRNEA